MTTFFMTEEEAEAIIDENIDQIMSKIVCATNNSDQSCASATPDPQVVCGCCVDDGTNPGLGPCYS